ncbi:hypothetical protein HOH45_03780 [bacterium]|jgi:sirohydrochlorin ferrochelatase|nr:hypothetical protein [bacterium]
MDSKKNIKEKIGLLIIDHGSRKREANHMLFELVKLVRSMKPDLIIYGAHMELAVPTIEDGINWCIKNGATHIIAHPYMLSPGRHAKEDIPRMINTIVSKKSNITYEVTDPLGVDTRIAELVLKRSGL